MAGGMGAGTVVLTGLYVGRSQLSGGSEVDPDELPLWGDQTE